MEAATHRHVAKARLELGVGGYEEHLEVGDKNRLAHEAALAVGPVLVEGGRRGASEGARKGSE